MFGIQTGRKFKALREKLGITQEQLGDILGVSGNTVSNWESKGNFKYRDWVLLKELVAEKYTREDMEVMKHHVSRKIAKW